MEVVLVGAGGLLGQDVVREGRGRHWQLHTPGRRELDLLSAESIASYFVEIKADWVINCAAYVAVDDAEHEVSEAFALNAEAARDLAEAALSISARMLHISTDYVFDGLKGEPYVETDTLNPLGAYARSKRQGEQLVLETADTAIVARTAWLYGAGRPNFPSKIMDAALQGKPLRLVADRTGSPTYTRDLAVALANIMEADIEGGIYHVVSEGEASWYDLCKEMLDYAGVDVDLQPAKNSDYPTPAARPIYSVLSGEKLKRAGIPPLPHWKDAVHRFVDELRQAKRIG